MVNSTMVVIPTHNHASTIKYSIQSVQNQTFSDLDIVIIGDGVGDDTRDVVNDFVKTDSRIRFIDEPKGESRNELVRHKIVSESKSEIITYLGDDDLFFPNHVEVIRELLVENDFVHPLPVQITNEKGLLVYKTNLKETKWVKEHLKPKQNTISLTGAAHALNLYKRLPYGWRIAPPNVWSDHYMWQQIFKLPDVKLETSKLSTTVKLPSSIRKGVTPESRESEIKNWYSRINSDGFYDLWQKKVNSLPKTEKK